MGKHKKKDKHHSEKTNSRRKSKKFKSSRKEKKKQTSDEVEDDSFSVPMDLMNTSVRKPETPEEYAKRQQQIRTVIDPETGRKRLIKGDGEILEEIVSREQHKKINKLATDGDGNFFQSESVKKTVKR